MVHPFDDRHLNIASMAIVLIVLLAANVGQLPAAETAPAVSVESGPDAAPPTEKQIDRWIAELGDEDYFVRQKAQDELSKFGFEAFDALTAATTHEDLEIAARAKYLLKMMRVEWTRKNDPEEVKKLLADYETLANTNKTLRMRLLAELPSGAGLAALCRLVRYEKSPVLSKQAAIQLVGRRGAGEPPTGAAAETVRKSLSGCNRPAAKWLLTWLRFAEDPQAAAAEWRKLIDAELAAVDSSPADAEAPEIAAALVRVQIERLKKLGENDQAAAAMRRLIDLEEGDPTTISDLLDWMIRQKAWSAIDELSRRFKPQFKDQPLLMYGLAQAKAEQGEKAQAENIAAEAIKLNPGKDPEQLIPHLTTAYALKSRGLFDWAAKEYRHAVSLASATHPIAVSGRFALAEMCHDLGRDLEAAEEVQKMLEAFKGKASPEIAGRPIDEVRSRMHYFLARHFKAAGDGAKQIEQIEKALEPESPDVDLLILCTRTPELKEASRKRAAEAIEKSLAEMRSQVASEPNNPIGYNQLAWLLGNTSTKPDELAEAIKLSEKSIELSPESGGYYDTLAHIYFQKGDFEKAVQLQEKAVEFEPHSGLIQAELKVFREKLDERKKP